MKTHIANNEFRLRAPSQPELKQQRWNLFVGSEPYGFVHASSEAEALDRVVGFNKPFRAVPADE